MVIGDHFGGGDHFDGGDHFGGGTRLPTFLFFRDRRNVAQQCWIRLHNSSNIVGATHAHYACFTKTHGLYPSHDALQVPTLLGVVASVCTPLPTCTQPYDFLPFWLQSPSSLGTLRSDDGDGNGNATKATGLISKTTILHVHHAFLHISLPSLHDYDVKMPNFALYRRSTQAMTKFPLSFCTWLWFLGIQL